MPKDGTITREKILDTAQALILDMGYSGMSVDKVTNGVGITKGAFFYHFKSKNDLAVALMRRFDAADRATMDDVWGRAEKLSSDPLQQVLLFFGLFEEMFEGLTEPFPGCLFASYIYEFQQFDEQTIVIIRDSFARWRKVLKAKLDLAAKKYPPQIPVDTAVVADAFTVVIEGAFITSKALNEPDLISKQIRYFRNSAELLFTQNN